MPTAQRPAETRSNRRFQICDRSQSAARRGSVGQVRPGRHNSQPAPAIITAEPANTQSLCSASVTSTGTASTTEATIAPRPASVTSAIGSAQHSRVPVEANSASPLTARPGVERAKVDLKSGIATVQSSEGAVFDEAIARQLVTDAGFTLKGFERLEQAAGAED